MRLFPQLILTAALLGGPVLAQTTPAQPAPIQPAPAQTAPAQPAPVTTASSQIQLGGSLGSPRGYTLADLQALPAQTLSVTYTAAGKSVSHTFKGVLLSDLILAAKPAYDARIKNASLGWYVLARGADGYAALFSLGEIDPGFGNRSVLLAYEQDGSPLPAADGAVRLVVPGDLKGGRYVSSLVGLTVLPGLPAAPTPN